MFDDLDLAKIAEDIVQRLAARGIKITREQVGAVLEEEGNLLLEEQLCYEEDEPNGQEGSGQARHPDR